MANDPRAQRDFAAADVVPLLGFLPDFIDSIQHGLDGNQGQAALSLLAALPVGFNRAALHRLAKRVEWVLAAHGIETLREAAVRARDLPAGPQRTAAIAELTELLSASDLEARINSILQHVAQGQSPTQRERWMLEVAKQLYQEQT